MPEEKGPQATAAFPCPRCGHPSYWNGNPSRPFCSERCKLIDLGAWAAENYRIPVAQGRDFTPESPEEDGDGGQAPL
jgi:endogenous inhibitor of DNA gyrase (YacG/DUF329 family)